MNEPGATGSTWRLHYSLRLPDLYCDHFELTSPEQGESFKRWPAAAHEVLLADRAYSHREAVGALIDHGAKVVVRLNRSVFPLLGAEGQLFEPLGPLRALVTGLCAIRKTELAAERAKEKARRKAQRQQVQLQPETLEFCAYVLVLTNLEESPWSAAKVLELYRCRWQVELAFKRLKSLLSLGYLPKKDPASARAWMQLKLLIALVTEKLCYDARFFSPWGC